MKEVYTLRVGQKGKERLDILNELYNPSTQQFLSRSGLKSGMNVLEVGCGTGEMACRIAAQIGPHGSILAIDNDAEQLKIAKELASSLKLTNIQFKQMLIYDLAFSRWIIAHLVDPKAVLVAMYNRLKPGGILANKITQLDSCFAYPKSDMLRQWHQLWTNVLKKNGKDIKLGYKLHKLISQIGCSSMKITLFQTILSTPREKLIISMNIKEAMDFTIKANIATKEELEQVIIGLEKLAHEDNLFNFVRSIQVQAQKPKDFTNESYKAFLEHAENIKTLRNIFIHNAIIIAKDKSNPNSKSYLSILPVPILVHILQYLNFPSMRQLIRSDKSCTQFIFNNKYKINKRLASKPSIKLIEYINSPSSHDSKFSFFKKQANFTFNLKNMKLLRDKNYRKDSKINELYSDIIKLYKKTAPSNYQALLTRMMRHYYLPDTECDLEFYAVRKSAPNLSTAKNLEFSNNKIIDDFFEGFSERTKGDFMLFCIEVNYKELKHQYEIKQTLAKTFNF